MQRVGDVMLSHGWSVQQQGARPKIQVADTNLGNLEGGPAFARRFDQAWPPTIPDEFGRNF